MPVELQNVEKPTAPARSLMPPHLVLRDFLGEDTANALLDYARDREAAFAPTSVGRRQNTPTVKPRIRVSVGMRELGPFRPIFTSRMLELVPELVTKLGASAIVSPRLELELVAHNDGAFYKRHIDTQTASEQHSIRVLSAVYYFHAEPKGFSGGALRLFAIGAEDAGFIDVEPEHNALLVFPSWAPHEVMPVSCPSNRFAESRFAVNCWVYRSEPPKPD